LPKINRDLFPEALVVYLPDLISTSSLAMVGK
jgi:hypothetical protein